MQSLDSQSAGCVCSIGFGQTFVVPVIDGKVIEEGVLTSRMGGMALTQRMQGLVIDEVEEEIDLNHLQVCTCGVRALCELFVAADGSGSPSGDVLS